MAEPETVTENGPDKAAEKAPEKSRTLILNAFGGHDKIKVVEKERQKPGAGQVLVNIEACGVNFSELMTRQGLYSGGKHPPKPPCELGSEGSGVICEIGEGVTTFQVGLPCCCPVRFAWVGVARTWRLPPALAFAALRPWKYRYGLRTLVVSCTVNNDVLWSSCCAAPFVLD